MAESSKKKKKVGELKLIVPAGKAAPAPPIGPALGQRGINIPGFCKEFNAASQHLDAGTPCPTTIRYYHDKSFDFTIHSPSASYLLMKAAGIPKGSSTPGKGGSCGKVTVDQLREIVKIKMGDLSAYTVDEGVMILAGSARSMGIEVV